MSTLTENPRRAYDPFAPHYERGHDDAPARVFDADDLELVSRLLAGDHERPARHEDVAAVNALLAGEPKSRTDASHFKPKAPAKPAAKKTTSRKGSHGVSS
jgi:hypothetical protein